MRAARVIRTNYSLLWQHLDATKVLPELVDKSVISETKKKEVESYQQSHGQNAVIIFALFTVKHTPEGLLTICDVLQTTPGKEHIAQHILRGTIPSVFKFRLVGGWVQSNIHLHTNSFSSSYSKLVLWLFVTVW